METYTPVVIYLIGMVVAYHYHRWAFRNYMENRGHGGDDTFSRCIAGFFCIASWATVIAITLMALITGSFTNDKRK